MNILEKLLKIQTELKAPKGKYNAFSKFNYRSCEDILEAVKPLQDKYGCVVTLSDEIVYFASKYHQTEGNVETDVDGRFYVKSVATIRDTEKEDSEISVGAFAREEEEKKGMSPAQITGSSSSYARKYALNGLFDIDDTEDDDTRDNKNAPTIPTAKATPILNPKQKLQKLIDQYGVDLVSATAKQLNIASATITDSEVEKLTSVLTEKELKE